MYNGKYLPLLNYLKKPEQGNITLSYKEIEEILGFPLPKSAYEHNEWWSNDSISHTQAKAWLEAGWKTKDVKFDKSITFYKTGR